MDTRVVKKKLGLKERYAAMTRGLHWDTTYQPMDKVFPYDKYEGIKIHDWDKWEDPFRLTMDAYWKYQAEKEREYNRPLLMQTELLLIADGWPALPASLSREKQELLTFLLLLLLLQLLYW